MGVEPTAAVSAGEVLAALSLATDLGTDQPRGRGSNRHPPPAEPDGSAQRSRASSALRRSRISTA
jgi:hypothetical protein